MNSFSELSSLSRLLSALTALAFALVGLVLFVLPAWSAANFSWKISPMVAMTMGGWYLGSAVMAGLIGYHRRWNLIYPAALYLALFSLSEAAVLVVHRSKLVLGAGLAWPYIGMLGVGIAASLSLLADRLRSKPQSEEPPERVPIWVRFVISGFVVFVIFLAVVAVSGHWVGLNGGVFPEPLSLFTLRSFGAFYFSLAAPVITLMRTRRLQAATVYVWGGMALIVFITAAALFYLPVFNFSERPFQSIYLGVYLAAFLIAAYYLSSQRQTKAL